MIIIDNIIFSLQTFGGISTLFAEIIDRISRENGFDARFLESFNDENNVSRKRLSIDENQVIKKFPRILERYRDVRLGMTGKYIFHSSYYRICRDAEVVNVTTVHDFSYEKFVKNPVVRFIHHSQKRHAVCHSEAIVCVSENTRTDLLHYFPDVDPAKISVIYNGVSDSFFPMDKNNIQDDTLLFVGSRDRYKNADFVVESIAATEYKIIFCGKVLTKKEKTYYDSLIGPDRYSVKTNITIEEMNSLMNSVKCLVYPSSYEGFGIPVLEAQKAGCPVIALNSSSIPEVIGDTPLLMQELSTEELLSKLSLLEDDTVRKTVIRNGIDNSRRFSWDETYRKYEALYQSLQ